MQPLRFWPIIKRAIWGGTRLQRDLRKPTGGVLDAAESWEVCDLPGNESRIACGPWEGESIRQLMKSFRRELLGQHAECTQFPLLVKFIDAQQRLSVQVHPNKPIQLPDGITRLGKAECWIVIDAGPDSVMYAGLLPGVTEEKLRQAALSGEFSECLHLVTPRPGDCFLIEPGTVHAMGGGLLIAEIQQPSDITYRLYDWDRVDAQGNPRALHLEAGLASTDFTKGPINPCHPVLLEGSQTSEELIRSRYFVIHRHRGPGRLAIATDARMHVLVTVSGVATFDSPSGRLEAGDTLVLPAEREPFALELEKDSVILDAFLPDDFDCI